MNFIQQVFKGQNDWWRYFTTLFLVFVGWQMIGIIPLFVVSFIKAEDTETWARSAESAFLDLGIDSNLYLLLMILSFIAGLIFLLLGVKTVHKRKITSLVTSRSKIDWKRYVFGFLFWFIVLIGLTLLDMFLYPENFQFNFKPLPFLILVLISFLFMPFQTSFEELLFRGYIMQGLGLLFRNAWVPLIATSIGFGLLHAFNPEVEKLGPLILLYYVGTGFLFGIITLMDEGTELALGMHASNNIGAAVLISMDWAVFQTDALFIDTSEPSLGMEMFLPVFVIYPLTLVLLSRKYGWTGWKQKLTGKIFRPKLQAEMASQMEGHRIEETDSDIE